MPPTGWNIGADGDAFSRWNRAQSVAEAGLQECAELVGVPGSAVRECLVEVVGRIEIPLRNKKADKPLLVLCRERQIEAALIDRLDEQLVGVADQVRLDLAQAHARVGQRARRSTPS